MFPPSRKRVPAGAVQVPRILTVTWAGVVAPARGLRGRIIYGVPVLARRPGVPVILKP